MKKSLLIIGAALMMLGAVSCSGDGAKKDLTDREVLALIYEQMNGANWVKDTAGWCSEKPLSEWDGVEAETDANGVERVVSLKLRDDSLMGNIPAEIGNLTELKKLWWETGEAPEGRVPASINKLAKLEHIQIDYSTGIAGGIKAADAPFPVEVWDIPTLQYVFLRCVANQPSTLPAEKIAAMKDLKNVTIIDCAIEGTIPAEMFSSPKLYSFSIYRCNLTGAIPAAIGNCPELSTVNLSYNKLSGEVPASLGNCTKLFTLSLNDNAELAGALPASLVKCEKLSLFSIKNTGLSAASLQSHPNYSKWRLD